MISKVLVLLALFFRAFAVCVGGGYRSPNLAPRQACAYGVAGIHLCGVLYQISGGVKD
jgi:hypothetical protein